MSAKQEDRIPAEQAIQYAAWHMPRIDAKGNILPSAEKEKAVRKNMPAESVETLDGAPSKSRAMTAALLEKIREEASREGYQSGFQQGLSEGRQRGHDDAWSQAAAEIEKKQQNLQALCARLLQPLQDEQAHIIALLQEQVESIVRAVIAREMQLDSRVITTLLEESLAALPTGAQHLRVYINPADSDVINDWLHTAGIEARVIADERLQAGGCRVESEHSVVDYSVETRLQQLLLQTSAQQTSPTSDDRDSLPVAEF